MPGLRSEPLDHALVDVRDRLRDVLVGPVPQTTLCFGFSSSKAIARPLSRPGSSGRSILPCRERSLRRRGRERLPEVAPLALRAAAADARRVRRPGARPRRALGAAARDRGGPRRLDRSSTARPAAARRRSRASSRTTTGAGFEELSAVSATVAQVREVIARARERLGAQRAAHDPLPRRDPPLQQGAAGRAAAGGRGRRRDADRRDDREPVLRGQLGAALAHADLRARAARGGRARVDRRGAARPSSRPRSRTTLAELIAAPRRRRRAQRAQHPRARVRRRPRPRAVALEAAPRRGRRRASGRSSTTRAATRTTTSSRPSSSRCAARTPTPPSTTSRRCSRAARTRASSRGG